MKAVKILLTLAALFCLSGIVGVFLPERNVSVIAARYGSKPESTGPFFIYVFRLAMSVMAGCSVFFFLMARDPRRHGALVPAAGGLLVFVGTALVITGFVADMQVATVLVDGLSSALLGGAIVAAWFLRGRNGEPG
jgi:hypothetical protein